MDFLKVKSEAVLPKSLPGGGVAIHSAEQFKLEFGEMKSVATGFKVDIPEGSALLVQESHAMGIAGVSVIGGLYTNADRGELVVNLTNQKRAAFEASVGSVIGIAMLVDVEEFDVQEVDANGDKVEEEKEEKAPELVGVVETPPSFKEKTPSGAGTGTGAPGASKFLDPNFNPNSEDNRHGQPNTDPQKVGVGTPSNANPPTGAHSEPIVPKVTDTKVS